MWVEGKYHKKIRFIGGPLDGAHAIIEMDTEPSENGPLEFNGMRFQVTGEIAQYLDGKPDDDMLRRLG